MDEGMECTHSKFADGTGQGAVGTNMRKNFFTLGFTEQQHRLSRGALEDISFLGDTQTHWETFLCHCCRELLWGAWTGGSPEVPSNSYISALRDNRDIHTDFMLFTADLKAELEVFIK